MAKDPYRQTLVALQSLLGRLGLMMLYFMLYARSVPTCLALKAHHEFLQQQQSERPHQFALFTMILKQHFRL